MAHLVNLVLPLGDLVVLACHLGMVVRAFVRAQDVCKALKFAGILVLHKGVTLSEEGTLVPSCMHIP